MNAKKIIAAISALLVVMMICYSFFWFWTADRIREEIKSFSVETKKKDIHILTRAIAISGFPAKHKIHFSGRITIENIVIEIPALIVSSNLVPGTALRISAPEGISLLEPAITEIWSVDRLLIDSFIPKSLPEKLSHEDLTLWRQEKNRIQIDNIELDKNALRVTGSGFLELDNLLQPAGAFQARTTGHIDFLQWLQARGYIETKQALLAAAVMSGLTKTDGDKKYMEAQLTLQNQTLFVGPLRLAYLPAVRWGWRNEPARLR